MAQSALSRFGNRCILGLAALLPCATLAGTALAIDDLLSGPTPLILKDGRIAQVSVHTIPFATGAGELDPKGAAELDALLVPLATDCFLTAQAIGHVEPGLNRDGDTLNAHRLARARADYVQAALAGQGMPLAAVASVWDWQFLVKQSRVTLWVFRLEVGDDCEGKRLPRDTTVAAVAAPAAAAVTPPPVLPAPASAESRPPAEVKPIAASTGAATAAPRELTTAEASPPPIEAPAPVVEPAPIVAEVEPPAPAEIPAPGPIVLTAEPEPVVAAEAPPAAPEATAEPDAPIDALPGPAIVFAVNSSYFSGAASRDLRAFVDRLPADAEVEIELAAAVGIGDVRDADPSEARRYNAWMAERRLQRVAEWLAAHAGPRQLKLSELYVENDPSREVRLQARVLP